MATKEMKKPRRPRSAAHHVFDVYHDADGEWRWRLWAKNGRIVAVSGEGFRHKGHAARSHIKLFDIEPKTCAVFIEGVPQ